MPCRCWHVVGAFPLLVSDEPLYKIIPLIQMNVIEVLNTHTMPCKYPSLVHATHFVPLKHFDIEVSILQWQDSGKLGSTPNDGSWYRREDILCWGKKNIMLKEGCILYIYIYIFVFVWFFFFAYLFLCFKPKLFHATQKQWVIKDVQSTC